MPTTVLPLETSSNTLTITLASLASSTSGVGRQSTIVDNTTTRYDRIYLHVKTKLGTSPTSGLVSVFLIRDDGTGNRDDSAGATDAGITVLNADTIGSLTSGTSPATGAVLEKLIYFDKPGPKWGVAIVQNTGVALDATGANHVVSWVGEVDQIQN